MSSNKIMRKVKYALRFIPDKAYIQIYYFAKFHKLCDFKNPKTFNEKLQWLKLNDRNPLYVQLVDKVEVKKYVADKIGNEYIIPTLGVWDDPNEIDFDILPEQFVLKCNHDSGNVIICKDKNNFDKEAAKKKLAELLKQDFYYIGREWPYKNVPRKILAEQYMVDESGVELKDYKIFNFNGESKVIQVDYGRFVEHKRNLYSTEWKYIEAAINYPTDTKHQIAKPGNLEEMLKLARILSDGFPHVRTDFYLINDKVYFGEMTFYHESGFGKFMPKSFGLEMGNWVKLPSGGGYLLTRDNIVFLIRNAENIVERDLINYEFMCFNGKVKCSLTCSGRFSNDGLHVTFFDRSWNVMPFERRYPSVKEGLPKPQKYEEMLMLAEQLARNIPFVRVDFYEVSGKIYFGELTLYPGSGFHEFKPLEWDETLGDWLSLDKIEKKNGRAGY